MIPTLHVEIGTTTDHSDLEDSLAALDVGEDVDLQPATLSIENLETFGQIFRPSNLELLEAIVENDPSSIRELAQIVGRHLPEVTNNINELVDYGLVELERDGRAKRPVVWYDEIDVDIRLDHHSTDIAHA
ncbi:MarR family transcriptional regulator [Natronoglomus mannanivorans]|uniref:MarR family transcriptional regulator n=1 Tax=Natronoglomus mannanivorans TaxID=2979990 RepID=A0AAP3E3F8_9EURY|nr:MarR family transcriptional regulator [Halobacteria archaeon AArc-xg1-1]